MGRTQLPVWLMAVGLGLSSLDAQVRLPVGQSQPTFRAGVGALVSAQTPSFRAGVNLVTLNVRVVDGHGQFVRGLAPADFQVSEDGVPQKVATFAFVDLPIPSRVGSALAASGTPQHGGEVAHVGGRTYVLLVDDLHISWDHVNRTKEFLRRFVRENFAPGDRATVIFTSDPRPNPFTDRPERLIEAIERFPGPAALENRLRALRPWQHPSVVAVSTVSEWLGSMLGHKALVFVSEYVGCRLINPNPMPAGQIGDEDTCRTDLMKATHDAVRANASIYTIDPRGLMPITAGGAERKGGVGGVRQLQQINAIEMVRQEPLRALADDTGGFALVGSNGFDDALDRLVRENSTYYVIGYDSTNDRHDGTFRRNDVRVNRRALTVKYRGGYIAPRTP